MSCLSHAASHWLNWMIDEPLSLQWASFKLNPPSIELQLIVPLPPLPLHFKSSFTISALCNFLSLPVCFLLVFHTHHHLSSPYVPFHALITSIWLALSCSVSLSFMFSSSPPCYLRLHQAISLPFFGFRWCL